MKNEQLGTGSSSNNKDHNIESSTFKEVETMTDMNTIYNDAKRPLTVQEFTDLIEDDIDNMGASLSQIEHSNDVKKANKNLHMYGRIKPLALEKIFHIMDLNSNDIFIDIGHGIGLPSLQAAYTRGCESRGIEVDKDRNNIAGVLKEIMMDKVERIKQQEINHDRFLIGNVEFRQGDFTEYWNHLDFIKDANKIFVNNAEGVFASRSNNGGKMCDDYIASFFGRMKANTIMVTCYELHSLGNSIADENKLRVEKGLQPSQDASFFECEVHDIGEDAATWGGGNLKVWVYKRAASDCFLCSDPKCLNGEASTQIIQDGEDFDLADTCVYCGKNRNRRTRHRKKVDKLSDQAIESHNKKKSSSNKKAKSPVKQYKSKNATTANQPRFENREDSDNSDSSDDYYRKKVNMRSNQSAESHHNQKSLSDKRHKSEVKPENREKASTANHPRLEDRENSDNSDSSDITSKKLETVTNLKQINLSSSDFKISSKFNQATNAKVKSLDINEYISVSSCDSSECDDIITHNKNESLTKKRKRQYQQQRCSSVCSSKCQNHQVEKKNVPLEKEPSSEEGVNESNMLSRSGKYKQSLSQSKETIITNREIIDLISSDDEDICSEKL